MTLAEIYAVMEAHIERIEEDRRARYEAAAMTANFVGCVLGGHNVPAFEDVYKKQDSAVNNWLLMKERMIDFAEGRNKAYGAYNVNA